MTAVLKLRAKAIAAAVFLLSILLALGFAEAALRIKNSSMRNYDIEMWRYSNELKEPVSDPDIVFDHVRSKSAILQSVEIRTNEFGLRGPELGKQQAKGRRILFLGGSITLGWGVPEKDTLTARLQSKFQEHGDETQVLNGGVGNYNTQRYVSRFFSRLETLKPTDIVVHYFLRDAEDLMPEGGNVVLKHSQLAVTLWIAYHRLFDKKGEQALVDHYKQVYSADAKGAQVMRQRLRELSDYARANGVCIYLAMMPDIHNLHAYKFQFIHDAMREFAKESGYQYIDLLPALQGRSPEELFAMPGDPHPNALGHQLMADALFLVLSQAGEHGCRSNPQR